MAKYRLRLISGTHGMLDGRVYSAGDVIETDDPLDKTFVNKFVHVTDVPDPSVEVGVVGVAVEVESDQPLTTVTVDTTPEVVTVEEPKPKQKPRDLRGRNVTKRFPVAMEQDFLVFKKKELFYVYDVSTETLINTEGVSEEAVDGVIQDELRE